MKTAAERAAEAIAASCERAVTYQTANCVSVTFPRTPIASMISREYEDLDAWADHILTICEGFLEVADLQGNAHPAIHLAVEKFRSALSKVRGQK